MQEVKLNPISYTSVPIKLIGADGLTEISTATAFFYKNKDVYFLVTNWHNVTGFHPETMRRDSRTLASPVAIEIPFQKQKKPIGWGRWRIPLYDDKEKPIWFIHKIYKNRVDVVVIELGVNNKPNEVYLRGINEIKFDDFDPQVADDVYILGFPYNLNSGGKFPLWKRGSIASEPDIDLNNLPKILIDTASRPGMSGSPVIFRRRGIHGLVNGEVVNESSIGEIQNLVGVYSGRINKETKINGETLDSQLGIVWKASVIQEIIDGECREKEYYPNKIKGQEPFYVGLS